MLARINHCPKHTSRARSSDAAIPPGRKNSRTPSRRGISTTRLPSPTGDTPVLQGGLDGEEHAGRLTVVALVDEGPRPASAERWSTCRFRRRRRRRSHRPPLEGGPDRGACGRAASWSAACAAAVRSLYAAVSPEPRDSVVGLGVDQINRRFAAACAAAGLDGRRTSHGGRVGLAVELTAPGASTHAIQLAGGWKDPAMVVRYAASISTRRA